MTTLFVSRGDVSVAATSAPDGSHGDQPFSPKWERWLARPAARLAISNDSTLVAVICAAGRLSTVSAKGELEYMDEALRGVTAVAVAGEGSRIAAATSANVLHVIAPNGAPIWNCTVDAAVDTVALSPNGRRLTASFQDGKKSVFEAGPSGYHHVGSYPPPDETRRAANAHAVSRTAVLNILPDLPDLVPCYTDGEAISMRPCQDGLYHGEGIVSLSDGGTAGMVSKGGTLAAFNRRGQRLWTFPSDDVCSIGLSSNGLSFVVGFCDGHVCAFAHTASDEVVDGIVGACDRIRSDPDLGSQLQEAQQLLLLLRSLSLVEHAAELIGEWTASLRECAAGQLAVEFFERQLAQHPDSAVANFYFGDAIDRTDPLKAASYFIKASREPSWKPRALRRASAALRRAGLPGAANSAFRRANHSDEAVRFQRILYRIGLDYEAVGRQSEAKRYYELVFAISPDYHDVRDRLLSNAGTGLPDPRAGNFSDLWASEAGRRFDHLIEENFGPNGQVAPELHIGYDVAAYMRYDASTPEDEMKKSLELLHTLELVERHGPVHESLDIGSATGRYPLLLTKRGVRAVGIDLEPAAVEYARQKAGGRAYPEFHVGDGQRLPFGASSFDLVTCMMGTPAHFTAAQLEAVFGQAHRCLRPNGLLIFSTWDKECPHLTFLSIYSEAHKQQLRRNSLTRNGFTQALEKQMFRVEDVRPVGLLPDPLHYDLDLHQHGTQRIRELLEMERSIHALMPDVHGQMFVCFARKVG